MRFFLVILTIINIAAVLCINSSAHSDEEKEELFLVRIIAIDNEKKFMVLENLNSIAIIEDVFNQDKNLIYNFESISKELREGDLIRIWGAVEKGDSNLKAQSIIKGKIYQPFGRAGGKDDPTGVRRRLKRGINSRPPPSRGGAPGGR
ncbi:MAG: hypothetical protein AB7U45_06925 [Desulfamplus sp.]